MKDLLTSPHERFAQWWKMQIDVYLPELKLGFEYQGEGHYWPLKMWGGEEGLKLLQERDAEKRQACEAAGLTLIEVPFWWDQSKEQLEQMIEAGPGEKVRSSENP